MGTISEALTGLRAELAVNPRLRVGMWLILGILLFYAVLIQADRVTAVYAQYAAEVDRLTKAVAMLTQKDWPELLESERKSSRTLDGVFWKAETLGLAQASLQAAIGDMIEGLNLRNSRIRSGVSQPLADVPGVWQIQVQLDGQYSPGMELQLLFAIASHSKKVVVDRLDLSRQNSRLSLICSAYFVGIEAEQE